MHEITNYQKMRGTWNMKNELNELIDYFCMNFIEFL